MKSIDTLVKDIYDVFRNKIIIPQDQIDAFAKLLAQKVASKFSEERTPRLRLSNLGKKCTRQLWYDINWPEKAEEMEPEAHLKFLIGDVFEAILLFLARAAGHDVKGEQDTVELHGVVGHRDGLIDGHVVDVKSASPYGYDKFVDGLTPAADDFGYLTQLDSYIHASKDRSSDTGAFLVGHKVLGKLALAKFDKSTTDYEAVVKEKRELLAQSKPPPRGYSDEPFNKSGNRKLGVACSYCAFKRTCWPGLRAFAYSGNPVFLTKVVKVPDVPEF